MILLLKSICLRGLKARDRIFLAGVALYLTLLSGAVNAQTADQLQLFSSLDPAQQQSLLQGLAQDSGVVGTSSGLPNSSTSNARSSGAGTTGVRSKTDAERDLALSGLPLQLRLQAEDTLLVEVSLVKDTSTDLQWATNPMSQSGVTPSQNIGTPAVDQKTGTAQSNVVQKNKNEDVETLTDKQKEDLKKLIELVRQKNPYQLDKGGVLQLPGLLPIPLAGLTVEQATSRLNAEPALRNLSIKLTFLPLKKYGVSAVKPYGYDLFDQEASTFAPVTEVPVPADYIVGSGDQFVVQLYGTTNRTLRLTVGRDGRINFPELGPIAVGGKSFSSVQSELESRVSQQMIGVRASLSMGETRSIRVFVLGEAKLPGSYTVSGLSTMTTALFASGGVKPIGSLRNIQLKRQGAVVRTLDLYDLLMKGDTSNDAKLMAGDVIYIPTVGNTVTVDGEVRRPAIYELKGNQTVSDLISLAGGLTPDADTDKVSLLRVDAQRQRAAVAVNLNTTSARAALRNGDVLTIARIPPTLDSGVTISGHVFAPRSVAWRQGLRLSDVIGSVDDLKPNADLHYVLIRRELDPDRTVQVLSADLSKALTGKGTSADTELQARDQITVFDYETDRAVVIKPILDTLRLQSQVLRPAETVSVIGRVKSPGDYPLEPGMKVSDLIRAGGSLQDAAYTATAELVRQNLESATQASTEIITIDLAAISGGNAAADLQLRSGDQLAIKELPLWGERGEITLKGEVRFPGTYRIQRGETLGSVLARAGGLTDLAFKEGSVFTRKELKDHEQKQLDTLATRMQTDLTVMSMQSAQANQSGAAQSLAAAQQLIAQLKATNAVGRLVINLNEMGDGVSESASNILVRDGDALIVPRVKQEVTVIGEVQSPTSHLFSKALSQSDYIKQSGGITRIADEDRAFIVRADGSVATYSGLWFWKTLEVKPGDTIVVPINTEHMPTLPLWQSVTQILYNVAISAAAINSF